MAEELINDDPDIACMECSRAIPVGAPYAERRERGEASAIVDIICVQCAERPGG